MGTAGYVLLLRLLVVYYKLSVAGFFVICIYTSSQSSAKRG